MVFGNFVILPVFGSDFVIVSRLLFFLLAVAVGDVVVVVLLERLLFWCF